MATRRQHLYRLFLIVASAELGQKEKDDLYDDEKVRIKKSRRG